MGQMTIPLLSFVIFGPALGAIAVAMLPRDQKALVRNVALLASLAVFALSLPLLFDFRIHQGGFQLTCDKVEDVTWIASLGVHYHVGVDGISLLLILLTTFLMPICILSTYKAVDERVKEYMIALLVLETGMVGALAALDVFLFYVFWEIMLVPMYLIIGVWGGPRRRYAAVKFFLYTMVGSVLMLVALLYVYFKGAAADPQHFDFSVTSMWAAAQALTKTEQIWLFLAFFLAFAIKVPLFPLHTWLPDAHVEAPTAGSVILAAVLLKMGTFGIVRYAMPMFPLALYEFAPWIAILSVIGIVYGALMAYVQNDVKSLVAYSSVSHLGFVVLGLMAVTPQGISGAVFQMLAHGVATGGLFLCVGFLYERRHTRGIDDYGGIARSVPVFSAFFVIIVLASAGLPGLNGFIGEFMILLGTATSQTLHFGLSRLFFFDQPAECLRTAGAASAAGACHGPEVTSYLFAAVAATGVILAAVYLLRLVGKVVFGPLNRDENRRLSDTSAREVVYLLPVVLMCAAMGLAPRFFTSRLDATVDRLLVVMNHGYQRYLDEEMQQYEQEGAAQGEPSGQPAQDEAARLDRPAAEPAPPDGDDPPLRTPPAAAAAVAAEVTP